MFSSLKAMLRRGYTFHRSLEIQRWLEDLQQTPRAMEPLRLTRYGRKAFSQGDEDGIILEIFARIGAKSRKFVEFGVEGGVECNTALLLVDGWQGLWMDGSSANVASIHKRHRASIGRGDLSVRQAFVTAENIDQLVAEWSGGTPAAAAEIDLLCIDVDGNDYWIWQAIKSIAPRVVAIEYNGAYPPPVDFVREYDPAAKWDHTNYHGASLSALEKLGEQLGYALVGCSLSGVNAFFVRGDALADPGGAPRFHAPHTAQEHYEPPRHILTLLSSGHAPRFGNNAAPRKEGPQSHGA